MTTLQPRPPYSDEELRHLYPKNLQLQLVQVVGSKEKLRPGNEVEFMRHGERTPEVARFQNTGLPAFWPYCNSARHMMSIVMSNNDIHSWGSFEWKRHLKTSENDRVQFSSNGAEAEDAICNLAEITDKGRQTTSALGKRLRHLYVHQLGFLPKVINDASTIYLRASPFPRALDSLQQTFSELYPPYARGARFRQPVIVTRTISDETLLPNEDHCLRLQQLLKAFSQRTAEKWDSSEEMSYVNELIQRWMPAKQRVAVNSVPRLHGIYDTINSTLATPSSKTHLPQEFYDAKARQMIDRILVEEEYSGYKESLEYRTVGIGALLGEVVQRMIQSVHNNEPDSLHMARTYGEHHEDNCDDRAPLKFTLSGGHDSTLAAMLASLGTLEGKNGGWPSYTSSIAVELFKDPIPQRQQTSTSSPNANRPAQLPEKQQLQPERLVREVNGSPSANMSDFYVRLRYNDRPVVIPGCKTMGDHWKEDESFCTLEAFKRIVDKFTPINWKQACLSNLEKSAFPAQQEPAGY